MSQFIGIEIIASPMAPSSVVRTGEMARDCHMNMTSTAHLLF